MAAPSSSLLLASHLSPAVPSPARQKDASSPLSDSTASLLERARHVLAQNAQTSAWPLLSSVRSDGTSSLLRPLERAEPSMREPQRSQLHSQLQARTRTTAGSALLLPSRVPVPHTARVTGDEVPVAAIRAELQAVAEALRERSKELRAHEAELEDERRRLVLRAATLAEAEAATAVMPAVAQPPPAAADPPQPSPELEAAREREARQTQRAAGLERDARRLRRILAELRRDNSELRREQDSATAEVARLRARLRQSEGRAAALRRRNEAVASTAASPAEAEVGAELRTVRGVGVEGGSGARAVAAETVRPASSVDVQQLQHQQRTTQRHGDGNGTLAASTKCTVDAGALTEAALEVLAYALAPQNTELEQDVALRLLAAGARLVPAAASVAQMGDTRGGLCALMLLLCRCLRAVAGSSRRHAFLGTLRRLGMAVREHMPLQAGPNCGAAAPVLANMVLLLTLTQGKPACERWFGFEEKRADLHTTDGKTFPHVQLRSRIYENRY